MPQVVVLIELILTLWETTGEVPLKYFYKNINEFFKLLNASHLGIECQYFTSVGM
jgi:hypothetical protein